VATSDDGPAGDGVTDGLADKTAIAGDGRGGATRRPGLPTAVGAVRYARRITATVRNVAEVVRFGGLETGEQPSPYSVDAEQPNYRLRHYFSEDVVAGSPPILLIPPLMMATLPLKPSSFSRSFIGAFPAARKADRYEFPGIGLWSFCHLSGR